jgi:Gluconate 2-dehydrogenase subunit 3
MQSFFFERKKEYLNYLYREMNRRETLKNLLMASGAMITLPSWAKEWSITDFTSYRTSFSLVEQELLASVADAIIPPGDSIGALSVGVDKYLQKLLDKCYDSATQSNVKEQLVSLQTIAQTTFSKSFTTCDQSQRQQLLLHFSKSEDQKQKDFFNLMKSETIRGFSTSKEVMVKYSKYKVAPGHYYGCVDVKS